MSNNEKIIKKKEIYNDDSIQKNLNVDEDTSYLYFIGRANELKQIEKNFKTNQYVYIYGKSGSGKTKLALQYISMVKNNYTIKYIKSMEMYQSFIELAKELKIETTSKLKFEELAENIKLKLNKEINIIFFIDNLKYDAKDESLNDFKYLISGFESNIKFLITTRDQNILSKINTVHPSTQISLDVFNQKDCLEYMNKKLKQDSIHRSILKDQNWNELFHIMSVKTENKITPIHLDKLISKLNLDGQNWNYNEIKIYLENEIENSFYLLKQENMKAFEIMCFFAFLNEECISFKLIHNLIIDQKLNLNEQQLINRENDLKESIDYLIRNSEIQKVDEEKFSIYEAIQTEILKTFEKRENQEIKYLNRIVQVLDELIDENTFKLDNKLDEYFNHAVKILSLKWKELDKNNNYLSLLNKIAKIFKDIQIKYDKALEYQEESLNIRIKLLPADHPDIAASYSNIGNIFECKGEYDKALDNYGKSLNIRVKSLPADHLDTAISFNNIGNIYESKGEYEKALDNYEKSLKIRLKSLQPNHPSIACIYNNIGLIYMNKQEYDKALEYLEKDLNISLQSLSANHPDIATSYNNIGLIYINKGEYEKALEYLQKDLNISLESLPPNHPDIATSYTNIGTIYKKKAIEYYEKSLNILLKSLPPNHPDIFELQESIKILKIEKKLNK